MRCEACSRDVLTSSDFYDECERAGMTVDRSTGQVGTSGGLHAHMGTLNEFVSMVESRKRDLENLRELHARLSAQRGMTCLRCHAVYCVDCLLHHAPRHPAGGKACPKCGGKFNTLD